MSINIGGPPGLFPPPYARRNNEGNNVAGNAMAGQDIEVQAAHQRALNETNENEIGCAPEHRKRINKFIKWVETEYPDYHNAVVFELNQQQKAMTQIYFGESTHDLRYDILNPLFTQLFISANKMKNAAAQYGFAHQRKYHDAILWGAKKVRLEFPAGYRQQMKDYLDTLAKEKTKAKEKGQVDEQEADPITFELFKKLCQWALESGNIMVWAFTILQWHCMGRSVNIAPLGFHNFSSNEASDSIVIKYDHNKKDKKGEKTSPKNCGFAVPPDFSFPSPNLRSAWEFFLRGFPSNMSKDESGAVIRTPVRPLRYIKDATDKHLPRGRVRKKFVDDWKPVLSFMYNKTKQHIINVPEESMDADFLDATYVAAREQLEEKYPSLFEGINADRNRTWKVSNWSKKIKTLNRQYRLEAI